MVKFNCTNCGYSFTPKGENKSMPPKICPYCNKRETVERQKTAGELLDEFTSDSRE